MTREMCSGTRTRFHSTALENATITTEASFFLTPELCIKDKKSIA